jgi:uncharacterized lipoprotein YajG
MMRNLAVITAFLLLQACAFTDATLKVEHDSAVDITGPISEAGAIVFSAPQIDDARLDKARIGWKKNGYGMNTADITSEQPVDVIVADAIIDAIKDNGHSISEDGQVRIIGTVDRFWFDTDINFWSLEFIGDVQCTLDFIDSASNTSIYRSSYSGNYKEKTAAGYVKTWTEVMSQAIDKLIEDIVFDEDLKEALAGYK